MPGLKQMKRLRVLKDLISNKQLCSQQQVMDEMKKLGFPVTQATLSRDFKQLNVVKGAIDGEHYAYALPEEKNYRRVSNAVNIGKALLDHDVKSIVFSQNVGVIKTRPGHAGSVAYNIDNCNIPQILGSIAGDDTVFIVIDQYADGNSVIESLQQAFELLYRPTESEAPTIIE